MESDQLSIDYCKGPDGRGVALPIPAVDSGSTEYTFTHHSILLGHSLLSVFCSMSPLHNVSKFWNTFRFTEKWQRWLGESLYTLRLASYCNNHRILSDVRNEHWCSTGN